MFITKVVNDKIKIKEKNKMVNSKKMSKSTVAVILLSLLLALSLILTATGAWFTDSANGEGNTTIKFGKVDVNVNGTATFTKEHKAELTVDGCSWTINGLTLENASTVDVYYSYKVTVAMDGLTEEEVAYFTIPAGASADAVKLAAGTAAPALSDIKVEFNSNGAMNGSAKTGTLKITVKIAAIQADHVTAENAKTELDRLLTA